MTGGNTSGGGAQHQQASASGSNPPPSGGPSGSNNPSGAGSSQSGGNPGQPGNSRTAPGPVMTKNMAQHRYHSLIEELHMYFVMFLPTGDSLAKYDSVQANFLTPLENKTNEVLLSLNNCLGDIINLRSYARNTWSVPIQQALGNTRDAINAVLPFVPATFSQNWRTFRQTINTLSPKILPVECRMLESESSMSLDLPSLNGENSFSIPDPSSSGKYIPADFDRMGHGDEILISQSLTKYVRDTFKNIIFKGDEGITFFHFWKKFSPLHQAPVTQVSVEQKHETLFQLLADKALEKVSSMSEDSTLPNYKRVVSILCTKWGNPNTQGSRIRKRITALRPRNQSTSALTEYVDENVSMVRSLVFLGYSENSAASFAWEYVGSASRINRAFMRDFRSMRKLEQFEERTTNPFANLLALQDYLLTEEDSSGDEEEEVTIMAGRVDKPDKRKLENPAPAPQVNKVAKETDLKDQHLQKESAKNLNSNSTGYISVPGPDGNVIHYKIANGYAYPEAPTAQKQGSASHKSGQMPSKSQSDPGQTSWKRGCFVCNELDHRSNRCPVPRKDRFRKVQELNKCTLCLRSNHARKDCTMDMVCNNCKEAGKEPHQYKHNYLLCLSKRKQGGQDRKNAESNDQRSTNVGEQKSQAAELTKAVNVLQAAVEQMKVSNAP